jgi:integrase
VALEDAHDGVHDPQPIARALGGACSSERTAGIGTPATACAELGLQATGMRVGELQALVWGEVDEKKSRFRVKQGKTASARRWVAVPDG